MWGCGGGGERGLSFPEVNGAYENPGPTAGTRPRPLSQELASDLPSFRAEGKTKLVCGSRSRRRTDGAVCVAPALGLRVMVGWERPT